MKQHYLPQCYLREFLNKNGKLHTIDTYRLKFGKHVFDEPKYPAEVCRSKDFYTIKPDQRFKHLNDLKPLHIEHSFHWYERNYPKIISKIKSKQAALVVDDVRTLVYALVDIKLRNQHFREKVIPKTQEIALKETIKDYIATIDSVDLSGFKKLNKNNLLKALDAAAESFSPNPQSSAEAHISSLAIRSEDKDGIHAKITDKLLELEWMILISPNKFITNDNPGVSFDKDNKVQNTKFDDRYMYFVPLTPSMCLSVSSEVIDKGWIKNKVQKKLNYRHAPDEFVDQVNSLSGYYLNRYLFSNDKSKIDKVADSVNKIRFGGKTPT